MAPPTIITDTVIPMHYFDDTPINCSVLLYITLRFDTPLSANLLYASLTRLLEIPTWNKLGARLRQNNRGGMVYHVPETFSNERPGFGFSVEEHEYGIGEHELSSRIPRSTEGVGIYRDLEGLRDLARRKDGPKGLKDFLEADEPQISVHVVSFSDGTLLSLSWMHTFMDATAVSSLLNAWTLVLDGREDEVPPICNFDTDPMAELGVQPEEKHVLQEEQLGGWGMLKFGMSYLWGLFWRDEQRTIYIPRRFVKAMRDEALKATEEVPFVSEGDVLCAYLTRLASRTYHPNTQIGILNAMNIRPFLPSFPAGVLLSNAVFTVTALSSAADILTKPLGHTASVVRKSILEQGTRGQIDALAGLTRASKGRPVLFGGGGMKMVVFSNWCQAGFFELDFGAAVSSPLSSKETERTIVKPSFVNLTGESSGLSPRGSWPILGRDGGGYWVQGNLRGDLWGSVEEELRGMN